jgi:hypothetical protein
MSRLFSRWASILTRVLVVIVVLLAAQFMLGRATHWLALRSVERALYAKADVAHADFSLLDRRATLSALRVQHVDPSAEAFLEAECCELDISFRPLLHKQIVVERGCLSGVRLEVAGRDNTGSESSPHHPWLPDDAASLARDGLANLGQQFGEAAARQFESLERAQALCARWSEKCAALRERSESLMGDVFDLQHATNAAEANRLRHGGYFATLPQKIADLRRRSDMLRNDTDQLTTMFEAERRVIVATQRREQGIFLHALRSQPIDANALSTYLLAEQLEQPLDGIIRWLRWARQFPNAAQSKRLRGEDILFAGARPSPHLLIRELQVRGEARFAGQTVSIHGTLTDVADPPAGHPAPMRLRLQGAGALSLELQATIDRTGPVPRDELLVDIRDFALPALRYGRTADLELCLAPSTASLSMSVVAQGDELTGDIQLVQKEVRISPELQGALANLPLAEPLESTLGKVKSLATRVSLDGTLRDPTCVLWSNLGPAVAEAIEHAVTKASQEYARARLAERRRKIDEQLTYVERQLAEERAKLATQLAGIAKELDSVAQRRASRERLSVEQIGHRLPEQSLFR